jgi:hypothetical protein
VYQRRFHPAATALRWSAYHLLVHALGRTGPDPMLARYEEVVAAPAEELLRIMHHAGEPMVPDMLGFVAPGEVTLGVNHTLAGSLVRLRRGSLPVRIDDEWRAALPVRHRRTTTLLSWPLLLAYGYLGDKRA